MCDTKNFESFYTFSSFFSFYVWSPMCLRDDLRRSVDSYIENRIAEYTYLPSLSLFSSGDSSVAGISSGIKFLVTNFVTFTSPRKSKSRAWHARHIHNGRIVRHWPDHCGKGAAAFDSSKLR